MAKNSAGTLPSSPISSPALLQPQPPLDSGSSENSEYPPLTKADLDISLEAMCSKLLNKFQAEIQKSTSTLSQEIAALGTRTDLLENKHDELSIAFNDLSREHDSLSSAFIQ